MLAISCNKNLNPGDTNLLLGLYPSILETDNRLTLPDGVHDEYKDGLYITRGFDQNIMLLTMQAFEMIYDKVTSLNLTDPVARLLLRMMLSSAYQAESTSDGKITISDPLMQFANLGREAVLVGQGDFMELWSSDAWKKQEERLLNVDADQFAALDIATSR
jgi:MraZ protein